MSYRDFSERLNKELDSIGVPPLRSERVEIFAKLLKVPKFKAEALLNGLALPEPKLLAALAEELEVSTEWLLGKTDQRKSN